jgi:hypothetical protein
MGYRTNALTWRAIPHREAPGTEVCLPGCTSTLRCFDRLLCDGDTDEPTTPQLLRARGWEV